MKEEVIVIIQLNLRVVVVDNVWIFGKKQFNMRNSSKSKNEAKNIISIFHFRGSTHLHAAAFVGLERGYEPLYGLHHPYSHVTGGL